MIGRISMVQDRPRRIKPDREDILDMPFYHIGLPEPCKPRHARRAARLLVKGGVRQVLTPDGFPYWPLLREYGLARVEPGDLCRTLGAPLALAALERGGVSPVMATVVLRGERVTRAMRLSALSLCPMVRNLLIAAPTGGSGLQAELRREYGVPALEDCPGRPPDLAVHFSPMAGKGKMVLDLSGPAPELDGFSFAVGGADLPGDTERMPLLAALWENGRLQAGEITVFGGDHT